MVPRRSQRHPQEKISDLDFASDTVEPHESLEKAQSQLDLLCLMAKEVGLCINTTKTKLITCNIPHSRLQLHGEDIENVEDFQYLGLYIASTRKFIKCRKGKAWSAFWKWDRVWKSPASLQQKVQLIKESALSVLLHGCESWVVHPTLVINWIPSKCFALESNLAFLSLIMLATRKFMTEWEQSPFPNQLKPDRSDSWAIVFGDPHIVNQELVDVKFYFMNMLQS